MTVDEATTVTLASVATETATEAPLLCREMLAWGIIGSGMAIVLFGLAAVVFVRMAVHWWRQCIEKTQSDDLWDDGFAQGVIATICSICGLISTVVVCESMFTAAKILVAPRLWLIERLSEMIK
jgi:hypothetical protein